MPEPTPASKTQRRALATAMLYAFSGGYGDATGYLLVKTFTGHVTGNLVLLALALPDAHPGQIASRIIAILSFLSATALGFFLVGRFRRGSFPLTFAAQAALLLATSLSEARTHPHLLILALCLALGLQNGVITTISGVSLHTTFISGNFTTLLSKWVKGMQTGASPLNPSSNIIMLTVILCFFIGAFSARLLASPLGHFLPASLLLPLLAASLTSTPPSA